MIGLITLIIVVVAIVSTNKIWSGWLKTKAEQLEVTFEDIRNDDQERVVKVKSDREKIIKKHGGWFTIEDIRDLTITPDSK